MAEQHRAYQHGYKQVSHHEWRTAENSAAYLLPSLTQLAKEKSELKLLDIGCGSGTITASLAKYMPSGQITAVDLSEEILTKARRYAEQEGVKITTKTGSVFELAKTFGENSFDVVHTSMMLCHLDDPVSALGQMVAVCKPGGFIAVRESDLRMMSFFPETASLKKWHESMLATHQGSIDGGARLIHWGLAAGVARSQLTFSSSTWTYSTPEEKSMWSQAVIDRLVSGAWRSAFIEQGHATEMQVDQMIKDWQAWAAAEDATYSSIHGELIIRK